MQKVKPLCSDTKHRDSFSETEAKKIINSTSWNNDLAKLACIISVNTGMRLGEILALSKNNVSLII